MEGNIYKLAAQYKIRFVTKKGNLCVEDLFVMSLKDLDEIYRTLKAEEKDQDVESLMDTPNTANPVLEIKIEIVKDIYKTRKEEEEAIRNAIEISKKKQRICDILASKKDAELQNKSIEELEAMLKE